MWTKARARASGPFIIRLVGFLMLTGGLLPISLIASAGAAFLALGEVGLVFARRSKTGRVVKFEQFRSGPADVQVSALRNEVQALREAVYLSQMYPRELDDN